MKNQSNTTSCQSILQIVLTPPFYIFLCIYLSPFALHTFSYQAIDNSYCALCLDNPYSHPHYAIVYNTQCPFFRTSTLLQCFQVKSALIF